MCSVFTATLTKMTGFLSVSLLTSMAAEQAEDVRASFLFVGDLHGYHQHHHELSWRCSLWRHGIAVSGSDQFVVGPTHAHGGTFHLPMTDVPYLVRIAVVAPIGNSDHSLLSAIISMDQAVPNETSVLLRK